ncbi:MAG: NHLP leader peptide family RiPP precursor [Elusimicrobiota bacterium]
MKKFEKKLDIERTVVEKATSDETFRKELMKDPKAAMARLFNAKLPPKLKVVVHEDEADTMHLVIPSESLAQGELDNDDLDAVTGGVVSVF